MIKTTLSKKTKQKKNRLAAGITQAMLSPGEFLTKPKEEVMSKIHEENSKAVKTRTHTLF